MKVKIKVWVSFTSIIIATSSYGQTNLILQPNSEEGKDALLHELESNRNSNYGYTHQFIASAWTFDGQPGIVRSVIDFDLSAVPSNANINNAYLSLYAWNSTVASGPHSSLSGSNACWLQRITENWEESSVTWNNQPGVTTQNQVTLPETSLPDLDYIDIDVTNLVKDMISDPENSHGFMIRLQEEQFYRRMNFCSSDHADSLKHPKLLIIFNDEVFPDSCFNIER